MHPHPSPCPIVTDSFYQTHMKSLCFHFKQIYVFDVLFMFGMYCMSVHPMERVPRGYHSCIDCKTLEGKDCDINTFDK